MIKNEVKQNIAAREQAASSGLLSLLLRRVGGLSYAQCFGRGRLSSLCMVVHQQDIAAHNLLNDKGSASRLKGG